MIDTLDKTVGILTGTDMATIREGKIVVRARFDVTLLKHAIEVLEKMGCDNVVAELADEQPIFFIPKQYEHPKNKFNSIIGVTVVDMEL